MPEMLTQDATLTLFKRMVLLHQTIREQLAQLSTAGPLTLAQIERLSVAMAYHEGLQVLLEEEIAHMESTL
jgi:hypothetical protein